MTRLEGFWSVSVVSPPSPVGDLPADSAHISLSVIYLTFPAGKGPKQARASSVIKRVL